jgi:hypothetical protein
MSLFHTHNWKTTGVTNQTWTFRWSNDPDESNPFTLIHQLCKTCGEVRTIEREGRYTLEELTS